MPDNFDREYVQAEAELERQMNFAFGQSQSIQQNIRRQLDLTDEQREERYIQRFGPIAQNLESAASSFVQRWEAERNQLTQTVHEAVSDRFGEHLARVSEYSDEKLAEAMETAVRTGQDDLAQAVAEVSLTREGYSQVFNAWAARNPKRAEALQRLHSLPDPERIVTRASTRGRVPPASPEALKPTQEDIEFVQKVKTSKAAQEREQRNRPRLIRRVGSRVEIH